MEDLVPPPGYYVKISKDKEFEAKEIIVIRGFDKKGIQLDDVESDDYKFCKERTFNDGTIGGSSTGPTSKSYGEGENKFSFQAITSVTPYKITVSLTAKGFSSLKEALKVYLKELVLCYNLEDSQIQSISDLYTSKIDDIVKAVKELDLKNKIEGGKLNIINIDYRLENQIEVYEKYIRMKCFNFIDKKDGSKTIDNITYGFPRIGSTINKDDKPALVTTSNLREYPYSVSEEDAMSLVLFKKISTKNLIKSLEDKYKRKFNIIINVKESKITEFSSTSIIKRELPFTDFDIIRDKNVTDEKIVVKLTPKEVLNKVEGIFTNGLIYSSFYDTGSKKEKDKKNKKENSNIANDKIVSQIKFNRNLFMNYFDRGLNTLNVSKELFKILSLVWEDMLVKKEFIGAEKEYMINRAELKSCFDKLVSIIEYCENEKGKERVKYMAKNIKDIKFKLENYLRETEDKEIIPYEINSMEEYLFVSGQVLYYLLSHSKKKKKNDLVTQFNSLRNINKVKDIVKNAFNYYGYSINYKKFNLIIEAIFAYRLGEKIILKDKDLWFYYNAGLVGNNIFYKKTTKELIDEDLEEKAV